MKLIEITEDRTIHVSEMKQGQVAIIRKHHNHTYIGLIVTVHNNMIIQLGGIEDAHFMGCRRDVPFRVEILTGKHTFEI